MDKLEKKEIPRHTFYDFYNNGISGSITNVKANEIIEEIIDVMRREKITVETSKQLLKDAISSIEKETVIT